MIKEWLDSYELKARDVPGLILVFPVLIDALYAAPILNSWPIFTASGICGFALIYALGHLARALGERIEPGLWASWGGPPSTRFMRRRDRFLGESIKRLIYRYVGKELSMPLLSEEDEARNPEQADKAIVDAFRRVRDYLRARDPKGLWFSHNVEYGFSRNLLGCRVLWAIISAASTLFAVVYGVRTGRGAINPAAVMDALSLLSAVYLGWAVLPDATRLVADGYAEAAWMAFLRKAEESGEKNGI